MKHLEPSQVASLLDQIKKIVNGMARPSPQLMSVKIAHEYNYDPFPILISCLLSLRARDTVTYHISKKLFTIAKTPNQMLALPLTELEKIIYSAGFYHRKALTIKEVSRQLIDRFKGKVPRTREELLSLPGVGRKTANLVLSEAFGIPTICVDTHVHRLANKLGIVSTKTPQQTEHALEKIIPKDRWIEAHRLLVLCGQNKCESQLVLPKK